MSLNVLWVSSISCRSDRNVAKPWVVTVTCRDSRGSQRQKASKKLASILDFVSASNPSFCNYGIQEYNHRSSYLKESKNLQKLGQQKQTKQWAQKMPLVEMWWTNVFSAAGGSNNGNQCRESRNLSTWCHITYSDVDHLAKAKHMKAQLLPVLPSVV